MSKAATPSEPAVSVVIPCFNLGAYLDEAVESVLAQTLADFEIVIVDDGSDDPETLRVLADYERPHTRVMRTENRGLAAARNLAIAESRGRYVCALDADDRLHPDYFARAVPRLDTDPGLTFVSCWLETFGSEQWTWQQHECGFPTLLGECTVATPALVRRSAVVEVGGFDEKMPVQGYEDWDLWITLVEKGHRGEVLPEVLFYYRRRPGSMSEDCTRGDGHLTLWRYLVEKHPESYRRHLFALLERRDGELGQLMRENYDLEREIHTTLEPRLERRLRELESLRGKLAETASRVEVESHTRELERDLAESRARVEELERLSHLTHEEVLALRSSKSWRVTAPLRGAYELIARLGRRSP